MILLFEYIILNRKNEKSNKNYNRNKYVIIDELNFV